MVDSVQDLVFLGNRLKGIIALSEILTTKEALENHVEELTKSVIGLKMELETLTKEIKEDTRALFELNDTIELKNKDAQKHYDLIIAEASAIADKMLTKAAGDSEAKEKAANATLSSLNGVINDKQKEIKELNKEINLTTKKLEDLQKELTSLKNRF